MTDSQRTDSAADKIAKTDAEWRAQLTPEQYYVTRAARHRARRHLAARSARSAQGMFTCVCCGEPLFSSDAKFESGTGWPSFDKPADAAAVSEHEDRSLFMRRTEVRCARCEAHLGHVVPGRPARDHGPALLHQRRRAEASSPATPDARGSPLAASPMHGLRGCAQIAAARSARGVPCTVSTAPLSRPLRAHAPSAARRSPSITASSWWTSTPGCAPTTGRR